MPNIRDIVWPTVDWEDARLVALPVAMIPYVVGILEKLHYRALYATDDDHERGDQDVLQLELLIAQAEGTMSIESALSDIVAELADMKDCVCALSASYVPGSVQSVVNNYWFAEQAGLGRPITGASDFVPEVDDLPEGYADWTEYHADDCDFAQEMFLANYHTWDRWVTNVLAASSMTIDALDAALIAGGLSAPLALALNLASQLLLNGPAFQADKEAGAAILLMKQDLVCAVYSAGSAAEASAAAQAVIDANAGSLTTLSLLWLRAMYSTPILALAFSRGLELTYSAELIEGYCADCVPSGSTQFLYLFPPCPGDWDNGNLGCWNNYLGVNGTITGWAPETLTEQYDQFEVYAEWGSRFGIGENVCTFKFQKWNGSDWVNIVTHDFVNTAAAGNWQSETYQSTTNAPYTSGSYRMLMTGNMWHDQWDPPPFYTRKIRVRLTPTA